MRRVPIIQGEHCVSDEPDVLISTLLGSCIAVCLQDSEARVGGMNHFLLGRPGTVEKLQPAELQRYGVHAMELLINEMMRRGAARSRLRAHLYGGANIVAGLASIGSANAEFARQFVHDEGIPVGRCELGGTQPRKVEFLPFEGRVRSWQVSSPPAVISQVTAASDGDLELF
jgi:chemotaxis protein CheD